MNNDSDLNIPKQQNDSSIFRTTAFIVSLTTPLAWLAGILSGFIFFAYMEVRQDPSQIQTIFNDIFIVLFFVNALFGAIISTFSILLASSNSKTQNNKNYSSGSIILSSLCYLIAISAWIFGILALPAKT